MFLTTDILKKVLVMLDLTRLDWGVYPINSPGIGGSYLKCAEGEIFYKLSVGDPKGGIYGHEAVNECIISDILDMLGIPHIKHFGERAKIKLGGKITETFVCMSENFLHRGESKLGLDIYYELTAREGENVLGFCHRSGFAEDIDRLLLSDFLFINRDRHGANIEVYKSGGVMRIVPAFDNGLSLVAPLQNNIERIAKFDPMTDCTVNNFIGDRSLFSNLKNISKPVSVNLLTEKNIIDTVDDYGEYLSEVHIQKIIEIIHGRYLYARDNGFLCTR